MKKPRFRVSERTLCPHKRWIGHSEFYCLLLLSPQRRDHVAEGLAPSFSVVECAFERRALSAQPPRRCKELEPSLTPAMNHRARCPQCERLVLEFKGLEFRRALASQLPLARSAPSHVVARALPLQVEQRRFLLRPRQATGGEARTPWAAAWKEGKRRGNGAR